jgi:alpha-D-xyloside xylohydrolase
MKNQPYIVRMTACLVAGILTGAAGRLAAANPAPPLLNEPIDVSGDFRDFSNLYYLADRLAAFDPATGAGQIIWQRSQYVTRQAFDNMLATLRSVEPNEFPGNEYETNPVQPFSIVKGSVRNGG